MYFVLSWGIFCFPYVIKNLGMHSFDFLSKSVTIFKKIVRDSFGFLIHLVII